MGCAINSLSFFGWDHLDMFTQHNSLTIIFSLRSWRSSSVIFLWLLAGKFGGNFGGNSAGCFRTHKRKAQFFGGNFRAFFVRKFVPPNKYFAPTSFCRRATQKLFDVTITKLVVLFGPAKRCKIPKITQNNLARCFVAIHDAKNANKKSLNIKWWRCNPGRLHGNQPYLCNGSTRSWPTQPTFSQLSARFSQLLATTWPTLS